MKASELKNIIREELSNVLREKAEEAAPVAPSGDRSLEILDKIKKLTKALQKQQTIRNNAAAQRLNAKFTGMLGKMTSYINQQLTPETPEESGEENV